MFMERGITGLAKFPSTTASSFTFISIKYLDSLLNGNWLKNINSLLYWLNNDNKTRQLLNTKSVHSVVANESWLEIYVIRTSEFFGGAGLMLVGNQGIILHLGLLPIRPKRLLMGRTTWASSLNVVRWK